MIEEEEIINDNKITKNKKKRKNKKGKEQNNNNLQVEVLEEKVKEEKEEEEIIKIKEILPEVKEVDYTEIENNSNEVEIEENYQQQEKEKEKQLEKEQEELFPRKDSYISSIIVDEIISIGTASTPPYTNNENDFNTNEIIFETKIETNEIDVPILSSFNPIESSLSNNEKNETHKNDGNVDENESNTSFLNLTHLPTETPFITVSITSPKSSSNKSEDNSLVVELIQYILLSIIFVLEIIRDVFHFTIDQINYEFTKMTDKEYQVTCNSSEHKSKIYSPFIQHYLVPYFIHRNVSLQSHVNDTSDSYHEDINSTNGHCSIKSKIKDLHYVTEDEELEIHTTHVVDETHEETIEKVDLKLSDNFVTLFSLSLSIVKLYFYLQFIIVYNIAFYILFQIFSTIKYFSFFVIKFNIWLICLPFTLAKQLFYQAIQAIFH